VWRSEREETMRTPLSRVLVLCAAALLAGGCAVEEEPAEVSRLLPNGARILVKENRASDVVAVQAWVADGALYESPEEAGAAYLLSQMMFSRTVEPEMGELPRAIELLGGSAAVNPRHDFVEYAAVAPSEHFDVLVDLMVGGLSNAVFDSSRFEEERRDALSSIRSIGQRPMERAHLICISELLEGHPYGRPVQGTVEALVALDLDDIRQRYERVYTGSNLLISVAGAVDPMDAADKIEERLSEISPGEPAVPAAPPIEWPSERRRVEREAEVSTGYEVMCFPAPSIVDEESITMDVLLIVLSGGRSSRLERVLSEEHQLVSAVEAGWYTLRQPSPLFVWMEVAPDDARDAELAVRALFEELEQSEVAEQELEKAKTYWKTQLYFLTETAQGQAFYDAYWTFLGWPELPDEYMEKIEDVTPADVKEAATKYFGSGAYATALLLPEWADTE